MANVYPAVFGPVFPSSNYAVFDVVDGTNFPVAGYKFDASTDESLFYYFQALNYGSGDISVDLLWYADTASSGVVVWGGQVAVITPNTDTQDIETDAFDTASTQSDTHLGTTNQRLHKVTLDIANVDGLASGDWVCVKLYRDADNGSDTLTGDAILVPPPLFYYSDT